MIFRLIGWDLGASLSALGRDDLDRWQNEGLIEVYGETEDVRPYLADAHVYVLPSYREGTPRTVLEALAAAMKRFIAEPGLAEQMGRESRKLAEEKFDVHQVNAVINQTIGIITWQSKVTTGAVHFLSHFILNGPE